MARDYDAITTEIEHAALAPDADRQKRMVCLVDALWRHLAGAGVSWVGFYLADESQPKDRRLILGPRRDTPACSPIGVQGVCGRAYQTRTIQIIADVEALGDAYVACDPRDRSELVLPLLEPTDRARCWGVLDFDSHDTNSFNNNDARKITRLLKAVGFVSANVDE